MATATSRVAWDLIDTVLVDMDGTLLDLAFDNFFWLELVPSRYAALRAIPHEEAVSVVTGRYAAVAGRLPWYCVDHWSRELGIDIKALKWSHKHLIRFLPRAPDFLNATRARGKRLWIVTNAHHETVAVKMHQTNVDTLVDGVVCSHDLLAPKESLEFWPRLRDLHDFDPRRTLLIEDSLAVLGAATEYGIEHVIAIRQPDSGKPPREIECFSAVDGVAELV